MLERQGKCTKAELGHWAGQKQDVEEAMDTYLGIQKHVKSIFAL